MSMFTDKTNQFILDAVLIGAIVLLGIYALTGLIYLGYVFYHFLTFTGGLS